MVFAIIDPLVPGGIQRHPAMAAARAAQRISRWIEGRTAMRVSMVTVVGLLVVTFAFWIGDAEAQHGAGKVAAAPAHALKKAAGAAVAKSHPAPPQGTVQQKAKAAVSKEVQKKQNGSPQQKQDAKKNQAHNKAEEKKVGKAAGVPVVPAQDSISLLNTAYQKLEDVNNAYSGHRVRAMKHIGAALGHLGSSVPLWLEGVKGQVNMSRPVSDTKLKEARASLEKIRNQFAAKPPLAPGNGDARRAVNDAIREIDSALIVR